MGRTIVRDGFACALAVPNHDQSLFLSSNGRRLVVRITRTRQAELAMADPNLARKLLTRLRKVPNPTPANLLAEFRRLVADEEATVKAKH